MEALGELWVHGMDVDWAALFAHTGARRVKLPTYPFQRERYWVDASAGGAGDAEAAGQALTDHPLLGAAIELANQQAWLFTGRLSLSTHPWLADHAVMGTALLPGAAFVDLALYAGRRAGLGLLRELTQEIPLSLGEREAVQLQVVVGELDETGGRPVSI
jgi:acyl transferase domain-containing protein